MTVSPDWKPAPLTLAPELLAMLVCPRDGSGLFVMISPSTGERLCCAANEEHKYPVVDGIPVLLMPELGGQTVIEDSIALAANPTPDTFNGQGIHPQVQAMVASTGGFMYANLELRDYPIPTLRWEPGEGRTLLDIGCNWGRWTVAAAKAGYRAVGLDPHLVSLRAAKHVAKQAGVDVQFVCGDARKMPFHQDVFDRAFSYSVVQHFSKPDARVILKESARVLRPGGQTLVQMPNRAGVRSFYHLARRRFSEGQRFDVRYYSVDDLLRTFAETVGPSTVSIDGYFGLGIQPDDLSIMPFSRRIIIHASERLRKLAKKWRFLRKYADSLYVTSRKVMRAGR